MSMINFVFFFSSRRRHTRLQGDWSSDVCSSDLTSASSDRLQSELADVCHGFVGADLAALAREAAMKALRRYLPDIDLDKPIPAETLEKMRVTSDDFKQALKEVEPSAMREVLVEVPRVNWSDVGGLEEVKIK